MIFIEQQHSLFLYKLLVWEEWYGDEPAHSIAPKKKEDKWVEQPFLNQTLTSSLDG
jgi:hypothetical protein